MCVNKYLPLAEVEQRRLEMMLSTDPRIEKELEDIVAAVSYTHLRDHETVLDLVCRLLLVQNYYQKFFKPHSLASLFLHKHATYNTFATIAHCNPNPHYSHSSILTSH